MAQHSVRLVVQRGGCWQVERLKDRGGQATGDEEQGSRGLQQVMVGVVELHDRCLG